MNWTQLKTVLWLRWRLSRNQFTRKGGVNAVFAAIGIIGGICLACAAGLGGFLLGAFALGDVTPQIMMLIWDGMIAAFLFFWLIGVMTEIQRSESIDLARLLHLPVTLEGVFVINFIASHFTMGIILFLPAMLGLSLGLIFGKGWLMIFLLPLVLTFIFMISAWTYCLRGWLIAIMVNPRRRRNVGVIIVACIMLLAQGPNLYFNIYLRHQHPRSRHPVNSSQDVSAMLPTWWKPAHDYVPLFWVPKGAMALNEGNALPAVLGSFGALLIGALGLGRAYRSTMRFYTGQEKVKAAPAQMVVAATRPPGPIPKNFIEKRVPFVSEDVAALALMFFRSMSRAPEVRLALFANGILLVVVFFLVFANRVKDASPNFQLFSATGAVAFTFFGLMQIMFNQFGQDRDGFRALVLSPTRRRNILLAKNLALGPIALGLGTILLALLMFVVHLPPLVVLAGLFQLGTMFLVLSLVGNFVSALTPYRVNVGSLKPTKPPPKVIFLMFLTQLLFPVAMIPVALPPLLGILSESLGILPAQVVDVILSFGALALAAILYPFALDGLGNFLESREQKIMLVVSQAIE